MSSSPPSLTGEDSVANENTPLLIAPSAGTTAQGNEEPLLHQQGTANGHGDDDAKPLPKVQIALLCYARLVEPIAFFSIFPFINKMIYETGDIEEAHVGFYSGLTESLFSLTQMLLMIPWGRAADKYGRKPVLVSSLVGVTIATALFGLSTKIWQMIVFRCTAGVFAGTVVTIRSMISEHSTPKSQARAFSWFAFSSNLGIFIGPFIGGIFSDPANQYPNLFGNVQFFKDFPYALPTFVAALFGLSATILSAFFITETLTPGRIANNKTSPHALMSTWDLIKSPGVANVVVIYGYTMLMGLAFTAVVPVFWFTDVDQGGTAFTPLLISVFLALAGISQALYILIVFTPLQHRIGTVGVLRICAIAWPFTFSIWPIANTLLRHHLDPAFWILATSGSFIGSGVSMAFTGVQLALNDIAPSHATLGTLNALALALVAGIRAIAPALFASIFAIGVERQILGGYLVWAILIALALGYIVLLQWLPTKAEGRLKKPADED